MPFGCRVWLLSPKRCNCLPSSRNPQSRNCLVYVEQFESLKKGRSFEFLKQASCFVPGQKKKWQLLVDDLRKIKGSKWILAPLPPATRWRVTRPRCKKNCVQAAKFKNKLEPKASLKTLIPTRDTAVNEFSHFENAKEFRRGWDSGHFACYYFYFQLLMMKLHDFCYNVTNLIKLKD